MKKIALLVFALLLALGSSYSFAETAGGTTGEKKGEPGGMTMEHKGTMKEGMMGHDEMMDHMTEMMKHMSGMMDKMSGMMKTIPKDKMEQMHKMMGEMSAQIKHMDKLMKSGAGTEKEMKKLEDRKIRMDKILQQLETQ